TGTALMLVGFGAYVSLSTRFTEIYGSLAGAILVMLATYLTVYVVLLGAVLNVQIAERAGQPDDVGASSGH
ncbi:MAG: YhjD/YihY/BrkB family envelope integrity protein, partial [Acidimicrobiales bacterium]